MSPLVLADADPLRLGKVIEFMRLLWGLDHSLQMRSKWMKRRLGVTGPQRLVLRIVGLSPGISASDVAATMMLHRSTMPGTLQRLEARGLITRRADPRDGRRALFALTRAGQRLNRIRGGTVELCVRQTMARLSHGQLAAATAALNMLRADLERMAE